MADDFAPKTNANQPPSFLNYSRGVEDNTYRSLFRTAAESLEIGAKAVDRGFTQQVKDEVRASVENADRQVYGIHSNPRGDMPVELTKEIKRLKDRREGMLSGRMSPAHYDAMLHAEAKRIRHRWGGADGASGYTEQIDDAFKELIGTTPANALRKSQEKAYNDAINAANSAKDDNQKFIDAVIKSGSTPPELVDIIAAPGAAQNEQFMYQLKSGVAEREAEKNNYQMKNLKLEHQIKTNTVNKEEATQLYAKGLSMKIDDLVRRGVTYQKLQEGERKANEARARGESISPQQKQELAAQFAIVKSQTDAIIAEGRSKFPTYDKIAGEAEKIEGILRSSIDDIGKGLADENFGVIKSASLNLKMIREGAEYDFINSSKRIEADYASRQVYGDIAFANIVNSRGYKEPLQPMTDFYTKAAKVDSTLANGTTLAQNITDLKTNLQKNPTTSGETGKAVYEVLTALPEAIRNDQLPPEMRYQIAKKVFAEDGNQIWSNLPADKRMAIYNNMINPENFKAIKKLAERDPSLLVMYKETAIDFANSAIRESSQVLNGISQSVSDRVVKYDGVNNRVTVDQVQAPAIKGRHKEGDPITDFTQRLNNRVNSAGSADAVTKVNGLLKSFEHLWEADGLPKEKWAEEGRRTLELFGITLDKSGTNLYERVRGTDTIEGGQGANEAGGNPMADQLATEMGSFLDTVYAREAAIMAEIRAAQEEQRPVNEEMINNPQWAKTLAGMAAKMRATTK